MDVTSSSSNKSTKQHLIVSNLPLNVNVAQTNCIGQHWHAKLGHPTFHVLKHVLNKIQIDCAKSAISFCDSCKIGKLHQLPFANCPITAKQPLELVYSDVWGPAPMVSIGGYRYYIVFVDAYTRYSWLFLLKLKSDSLQTFINFHKLAELQYNFKLKGLQTDNGEEFKAFLPYLQSCGIQPIFSCPYTHQQNGVVERKHRHITEMGMTLLTHA